MEWVNANKFDLNPNTLRVILNKLRSYMFFDFTLKFKHLFDLFKLYFVLYFDKLFIYKSHELFIINANNRFDNLFNSFKVIQAQNSNLFFLIWWDT